MRTFVSTAAAVLLLVAALGPALAGEPAPDSVKQLAATKLAAYGQDPVIVAAVKAANAEGRTMAQIQARDTEWMATPGLDAGMEAMQNSACGKHLQEMRDATPYLSEIFVMDNQGANVAMSDKTSDYWQGDEAKFKNSYADGKGGLDISDVKFDDSTQAYLVQVSVPVKDGDVVIGAITFGIDVDKLAEAGV